MSIVVNANIITNLEGLLNKIELQEEYGLSYQHLVKADALRLKHYFWDSIDEYLKVLEIDNQSIEAYRGLGLAYKQVGCSINAVNAFNNAKKINPFDKDMYFEAGCCYCMCKNYAKAAVEFKRTIKLCPDFEDAQYKLAMAYELDGQYEQAITEYQKLMEKNPNHLQAYNSLGSLYMKLNLYNEAFSTFSALAKTNSDYIRAYLGIAISLDKLGKRVAAVRYYKKYLKHRPNSDNVPYILDRLNELQKTLPNNSRKSHLMLVS